MKSICLKTNNTKSIEYLLKKLNNFNINSIYYSYRQFKTYKNIIIHFKGKEKNTFLLDISKMLSDYVVDVFEETMIKNLIKGEYFYFNKLEQKEIFEITINDLLDKEECVYSRENALKILCNDFYEYLLDNKSLVLNGFLTFRIKNYIEILAEQIDKSVNKYIIEREYTEFISLLKMYINTEENHSEIVNLVYNNSNPILLDKDKNIILVDSNIFNAKYLSDISFSTNDYALNALLTLNPKKIYIHLIDNNIDEFISTLKLVFENKVTYCTDCNICNLYKSKKLYNNL